MPEEKIPENDIKRIAQLVSGLVLMKTCFGEKFTDMQLNLNRKGPVLSVPDLTDLWGDDSPVAQEIVYQVYLIAHTLLFDTKPLEKIPGMFDPKNH